jgi:hypothetical protein
MMRKIYRSRTLQCILAVGIALLVAGVVTFTYRGTAVHAQVPVLASILHSHDSGESCTSVDATSNGGLKAALDLCKEEDNGNTFFKAVVFEWNAPSTSIRAGLQGQGMLYTKQCAAIACSTPAFSASEGNVICYQAFSGTTATNVACYTVPANSNIPLFKG